MSAELDKSQFICPAVEMAAAIAEKRGLSIEVLNSCQYEAECNKVLATCKRYYELAKRSPYRTIYFSVDSPTLPNRTEVFLGKQQKTLNLQIGKLFPNTPDLRVIQ